MSDNYKEDCFAFVKEKKCSALTVMKCDNCNFYKPVNNPDYERSKIERSIDANSAKEYTRRYSHYVKKADRK